MIPQQPFYSSPWQNSHRKFHHRFKMSVGRNFENILLSLCVQVNKQKPFSHSTMCAVRITRMALCEEVLRTVYISQIALLPNLYPVGSLCLREYSILNMLSGENRWKKIKRLMTSQHDLEVPWCSSRRTACSCQMDTHFSFCVSDKVQSLVR